MNYFLLLLEYIFRWVILLEYNISVLFTPLHFTQRKQKATYAHCRPLVLDSKNIHQKASALP